MKTLLDGDLFDGRLPYLPLQPPPAPRRAPTGAQPLLQAARRAGAEAGRAGARADTGSTSWSARARTAHGCSRWQMWCQAGPALTAGCSARATRHPPAPFPASDRAALASSDAHGSVVGGGGGTSVLRGGGAAGCGSAGERGRTAVACDVAGGRDVGCADAPRAHVRAALLARSPAWQVGAVWRRARQGVSAGQDSVLFDERRRSDDRGAARRALLSERGAPGVAAGGGQGCQGRAPPPRAAAPLARHCAFDPSRRGRMGPHPGAPHPGPHLARARAHHV